jgi:hypothetical protein
MATSLRRRSSRAHYAGAARAKQLHDCGWTNDLASMQGPPVLSHRLREPVERGLNHEFARGRVGLQKRDHLRPQRVIRFAGSADERGPLVGVELPRLFEESK